MIDKDHEITLFYIQGQIHKEIIEESGECF